MNELDKLLRKVSPRDKVVLRQIIHTLLIGKTEGFRIEKLEGGDLYKTRKGDFRFIFHYEQNNIIIDAVRLRNEKTYRGI